VLLFVLSINFLIYLPHIIILLLGWDGLGLTSFILVIYYQNAKSLAAGILTALSNRVGDALLLIAIALTLNQGHWYIINIRVTRQQILLTSSQIILIIVAAITKRAQIPFSRWLPAAIAAPTPVRALVHSSTLVTAGVFLLIRFNLFLNSIPIFSQSILIIGTTTIFIAGLRAITECDIKKIIALSTLSQLGLIMIRIGIKIPNLAFFHIVTHAIFKALLFICAGSFINYHHHTQDLRWIGHLTNQLPITSRCITIANIALCGIPFISGFYSKDIIIEWALYSNSNILIIFIRIIRVGVTTFYSIRFRIVTIWSNSNSIPHIILTEEQKIIKPIIILASMATISGRSISWINPISSTVTFIPLYIKLTPLFIIATGITLRWWISSIKKLSAFKYQISHLASCSIWFLVPLSTQFIITKPYKYAHNIIKLLDQGWLESPQIINKSLTTYRNTIINISPLTPHTIIISSLLRLISISSIITIINLCTSSLHNKTLHWRWRNGYPLSNIVCSVIT
jgi:NADH-ubiquinone oxidoreductase chain 5